MRHPRRLSNLSNRVCHSRCKTVGRTPNPQSDPAVIVLHRIVKPRLDDELAALEDARTRHRHRFIHRRTRAWRDANAVIANLIHPQANMPQDVFDELRVIDDTVLTAGS